MPASIRHLGPGIEVESGTFENEFRWMHNRFWEGREITGFLSGTSRDLGQPQIPSVAGTYSAITNPAAADMVLTVPAGHGIVAADVITIEDEVTAAPAALINGIQHTVASVTATTITIETDGDGGAAGTGGKWFKQGRTAIIRMGMLLAYDTSILRWVPWEVAGANNRDRVRGVLAQTVDVQPDGVNRDCEVLIVTNAPLRPSRLIEPGFTQTGLGVVGDDSGHNSAAIRTDLRDEMLCPLDDQFENA